MGPEKRRLYWTKEEILPRVMPPFMYRIAPNTLIRDMDRLLMRFTDGPIMEE